MSTAVSQQKVYLINKSSDDFFFFSRISPSRSLRTCVHRTIVFTNRSAQTSLYDSVIYVYDRHDACTRALRRKINAEVGRFFSSFSHRFESVLARVRPRSRRPSCTHMCINNGDKRAFENARARTHCVVLRHASYENRTRRRSVEKEEGAGVDGRGCLRRAIVRVQYGVGMRSYLSQRQRHRCVHAYNITIIIIITVVRSSRGGGA